MSLCISAGRTKVLALTIASILAIAAMDWAVGNSFSLGVLYILPMMLAGLILTPPETAGLALFCAFLRFEFDTPGSHVEIGLRFVFASVAYFSSGLFIIALIRNHKMVLSHLESLRLEQSLRSQAENQLGLLVESSPAAIITLDGRGTIVAANRAANSMFAISAGQELVGRNIIRHMPLLADALRFQLGSEVFRTAAQCQGKREDGEIFLANTWFSSYGVEENKRVAAIIVDSSEEMRDREERNLRELMTYNRIAAAAVSHELRNVCAALALLASNLGEKFNISGDRDYQAVLNLVNGLEKIASLNLRSKVQDEVKEIELQGVLDSLRIIIEAEWREIGGKIHWPGAPVKSTICADPHGLLQALLNLVQNSYRAVQASATRELSIGVEETDGNVFVRIRDSGPGVVSSERLFHPFQSGTDSTGLGLYISRAIVRSYGGDLKFEPQPQGSCFVVELQVGTAS